jgi:hypothetical protein
MAESTRAAPGRIFLSYRRQDTSFAAGWLYDRLAERFGDGQVFKDVDSIELGDDFIEAIVTAVDACDVLLALIGDRWLTITGTDGKRRLDDPEDFVRLEIEAAMTRGVRVIPILVAGARMPDAVDLPPSLAMLVRRQALELSPNRFDADLSRLLKVLNSTLAEAQGKEVWQAEGWFRAETESQRPRAHHPETAESHSDADSPSVAAYRYTTGYDSGPPAQTVPPLTSWPSGSHGTTGGSGVSPVTRRREIAAASQVAWFRRLIGYGRFWFGLLLILVGWIPFLANIPYSVGYESRYRDIPNLHVYIEQGLGALILLGVLLVLSALVSALRAAHASGHLKL